MVHVVCSDQGCAEELEAVVETLDDVDDLVCECSCGTVLVSVAELDSEAPVVELNFDRSSRLAA